MGGSAIHKKQNVELDGCANLQKIKWQEKGTSNLHGKTFKMRESWEKNSLCDKFCQKILLKDCPYLSLTHPWYAHNPHNFITQYSLYGALIFFFHTFPSVIPATLFSLFLHNSPWLEFLSLSKWSLKAYYL